MDIDEKYAGWKEIYFNKFFSSTKMPAESINSNGLVMGDGTINLAELMQYLYVCKLLNTDTTISIEDCLKTLNTLVSKAKEYYADKFDFLTFPEYNGFFLRDNCEDAYTGAMKSLTTLENEDPCFSPFISQDQVWNLNPILMAIATCDLCDDDTKTAAADFGYNINAFIKDNKYKVMNPYLSYINHYFTYCPDFDITPNTARQEDRETNFTPDIKVKRGANNWYYSGGTKSCVDAFKGQSKAYTATFRTFLYKCIIFTLDKLYEPLIGLFGHSFKHNSYNCYAATSGIWYNSNFAKSRAKKTNKQLKKKGEFYNWNTDFLAGDHDTIDWDLVKEWLENYTEPDEDATSIDSPIEYLVVYSWYQYHLLFEVDEEEVDEDTEETNNE